MAKLVANEPVDTTALEELAFLLDPTSVSFEDRQSHGFVVESGDVRTEVGGTGFRYLLKAPLPAGTVTKIEVFESGELAYKLTGLNIKMRKLITADDVEEAVLDMLSGDDKLRGSSGNDTLAGGKGDDQILGKAGEDTLFGQKGEDLLDGGLDFDTLDGGGGKDTYLFKDAPDGEFDEIVKFQSGEIIQVKAKSFAGLSKGVLADDQFVEGTEAQDGDDRFIYDPDSGALYHDVDGVGSDAQIQVALLQNLPSNFGAGNILVI